MNKLTKLADFIEQNPDEFDQWSWQKCIIGTGNRLNGHNNPYNEERFSAIFDLSLKIVNYLSAGEFNKIDKSLRKANPDRVEKNPTQVRKAVKALRFLAGKENV